jgi:hypothetical protein
MPKRSILSRVPGADIIGPSCRLHKEHEAMISDRNVLKPCLPLVGVPGMFLQHCFDPVDGWRVFLLKDLISDDARERIAGDVPSRSR